MAGEDPGPKRHIQNKPNSDPYFFYFFLNFHDFFTPPL